MSFNPTIDRLAVRWKDAGVLLPAFPLLAGGRPLGVDEIAGAAGVSEDRVSQALESGRCGRDATGRLIDLYGMTLTPTLHRLEIDGRILFSCCALWAHVIPRIVGQTVRIESVDPTSRELVRLSVSPYGVESFEPVEAVATMVATTEEALEADVCAAFCCHVRHFVSRASAGVFAAAVSSRQVIELSELQEAANLLHSAIGSAVEA